MRLGGAFEEQELCSKASRAQEPVCINLRSIFLFVLTSELVNMNQSDVSFQQNVEKLVEEVQEARRIKRMHQPTKVQLHFCASNKYLFPLFHFK